MEQKDYRLEIVGALLRERNHIRGIAGKIGTNHMLVARKIRELAQANVVDFVQDGRNKTYFLKKTAEARAYALMAESYRTVLLLAKYPGLRGVVEKIQKDSRICMAVIFGSYAKGLAAKGSDIDLFIGAGDRRLREELHLIDSRLSIKIGEYDRKNPLIQEMERDHIIIKGIEEFYEKNQFFG